MAAPAGLKAHLERDPMGEAQTARLASGPPNDDATDATEAETPRANLDRLHGRTPVPGEGPAAGALERATSALGQGPGDDR